MALNKSISESEGTTWDEVFIDYQDSKKEIEKLVKDVQERFSKSNQTIENCALDALKNEHHLAFANYYLSIASRNKRFSEYKNFRELVDDFEDSYGKPYWRKDLVLLKPSTNAWRSPEFNPEMYDDVASCKKLIYGSTARDDWKCARTLPDRDVILQIGIAFGLSESRVNELLLGVGSWMIDSTDIVEAVCDFYLNYYQKHDIDLKPNAKLKVVKTEINKYLKNASTAEKIGYTTSSKNDFSCAVCIEKVVAYDEDGTAVLTHSAADRNQCDEELTECGDSKKKLDNYIKVFLPKFYGYRVDYITELAKFYSDGEAISRGLRFYDFSLRRTSVVNHIDIINNSKTSINPLWEKYFSMNDKGLVYPKDLKKSGTVSVNSRMLFSNWVKPNHYEKHLGLHDYYNSVKSGSNQKTIVMRDGDSRKKVNNKTAYRYLFDSKEEVTKLLVCAGKEDQYKEVMQNLRYADISYNENGVAQFNNIDRIDALILYSLEYRDALIDSWCDGWSINDENTKQKCCEHFPFLKLLSLINRDIMKVYWVRKKSFEPFNKEEVKDLEDLEDLFAGMICPIELSDEVWFKDGFGKALCAGKKLDDIDGNMTGVDINGLDEYIGL